MLNKEKQEITHTSSGVADINQIFKQYKLDPSMWTVTKKNITKVVSPKGEEKHTVKLTIEKNLEAHTYECLKKDYVDYISSKSKAVPDKHVKSKFDNKGLVLQINIFDFHFGKLSWHEETGNNYDTKIAKEAFGRIITETFDKSKHLNISRILLPVGNDFFNSDKAYPYNATTAGTPQEEDLRWQRTFREGAELLMDHIRELSKVAKVHVVMVPGNHDRERNFYLGETLFGHYKKDKNVTVDNRPIVRKYVDFGNVLLGFTHGSEENWHKLPVIMAEECRVKWGNARFREWHLGHIHHKKEMQFTSLLDSDGVIIRYAASVSPADAWHHRKGFTCSQKISESYVWHPERGMEYVIPVNF